MLLSYYGFEAEGIFHTGIQRTVGGGKQVAFDSHFLCGNGKGAAEQKTRKDIPGFHVLLYIGLVGFKEYFQVISGFFRAFGFGGFQHDYIIWKNKRNRQDSSYFILKFKMYQDRKSTRLNSSHRT